VSIINIIGQFHFSFCPNLSVLWIVLELSILPFLCFLSLMLCPEDGKHSQRRSVRHSAGVDAIGKVEEIF
jgi:hypothetical protein